MPIRSPVMSAPPPPTATASAAPSSSAPSRSCPPFLFVHSVLEPRDDLDERHERCFQLLTSLISDKTEKEANDALLAAASHGKEHEDICLGLIVGILGDAENAHRYYRDLTLVARDGLQAACSHLTLLVLDKYPKMYPLCKQQLLWLTKEMIRSSVHSMETIVWNLMRQIAGGDVSRVNLWLADQLLDILVEQRAWLEKFSFLLASVVYTYLRLIEDHVHVEKLREKEVRFVVSLMRDRFSDVVVIGRDLVRVLQYVAKVPEIGQLWQDILFNPKSLSPNFNGITQLMRTRTSRRFLQSRITPEMEKKLFFLTAQVRFGTHKRYQDWFQRQYLSTSESQSLRCDLIRFIVGVIHPTNELLGSDIIPRWAIIGWLLTTCTNQVASSNAKLALFHDWLYFTPDKDNIMNIEPAILVMHHSMKPHPAITATLLDFLCRIVVQFYPRESDRVRTGIYNSLATILEKRVLPSLEPLFENQRLDKELRTMLRERFAPFVSKGAGAGVGEENNQHHAPIILDKDDYTANDPTAPRFSDDEDDEKPVVVAAVAAAAATNDVETSASTASGATATAQNPSSKNNKKKTKLKKQDDVQQQQQQQQQHKQKSQQQDDANDDEEEDNELDEIYKDMLIEVKKEADVAKKCELLDQLVKKLLVSDDGDGDHLNFEQCSSLASLLADSLHDEFEGKIFPAEDKTTATVSSESIEESIGRPMFVLFRTLCELTDTGGDTAEGRTCLLQLLSELYTLQPRVGYYLLYFMSADRACAARPWKEKAGVYKDLCETIDPKYSLDICLVNDMRQCQEDDVNLFVYLVPEIFATFPKQSVGNVNLLYLLVSCVDGRQVQSLVCRVMARDLILFKKDSFTSILRSSLTWETFEQYVLWKLAGAHDLPIECVLPLVPKLSYVEHAEALSGVLLALKQERPTLELVKQLLLREVTSDADRFVTSAITYWMHEYNSDKLADMVANHLIKQASLSSSSSSLSSSLGLSSSSNKRRRNQQHASSTSGAKNGSLAPSAMLCLTHLDQLRRNSKKQQEFFSLQGIQSALLQVRYYCTDTQKKKFSDLFALAESDSETDDPAPAASSSAPSSTKTSSSSGHKKSGGTGGGGGGSSKQSNSTKSPAKTKSKGGVASKQLSDVSGDSSEESDESEKPLARTHMGGGKGRGSAGSGSGAGTKRGASGASRNKKPRKRAGKISYKISSDDSSDDDEIKIPKKRKKLSHSDSD